METAIAHFKEKADQLRKDLEKMESQVGTLQENCEEYKGYASDKDEKELIIDARNHIAAFGKSTSVLQIDEVLKMIKKLE